MDIRLIPGAVATDAERAAIDAVLGPRPPDDSRVARGGPSRRTLLLPALHAAQARAGWISPGALNHLCERLDVPPAEAYGVASFYHLFSTEPRPARIVHVCDDIACRNAGAEELLRDLGSAARRSPCLGQCERAPAALVQSAGERPAERAVAPATPERIAAGTPPPPLLVRNRLRLLRRIGIVDPESLDAYLADDGFKALGRARELGPEGVIRELLASKLVGRGGAAFPAGRKWEAVARAAARPHYFVLNADESEPGTFKDRYLMEGDPFAVIEATAIGALATGSERAFIYVRGEYPLAAARLESAIRQCEARGLLGVEVELRRGAGAYICGEETALFNSIEGLRGEPRQKPPFPVQAGLFGKPTAINNVETVANVADIVLGGGAAFAATETKLFCLSGAVERPGLYEVAFGLTLRELLRQAGATPNLQAVLLGGAAGSFLTPAELDVALTLEGTRAIGASLGSGVVMAFDERTDLRDIVLRIAAFFRDESCGQCVPCRVGTVRQHEAFLRGDAVLLGEIGQAMRDGSICGLGQTASSAVESALRKFPVLAGRAGP